MSVSARTPEGLAKEVGERTARLLGAMDDGYVSEIKYWAEKVRSTLRQVEQYYEQEGR